MSKISVLIPVYRESTLLEGLLTDLIRDTYKSKEVLVTIDEPTELSLKVAEKFRDKVTFILNEERIGKVKALNEAFKHTTGNILLFLDSDVQLQANGASFLDILEKEMENIDVLDIKKSVVRHSFLDKLVHYEYLGSSLVSWFFSNRVGRTLGLNGAAFAIRREAFEQIRGFRRTIVDDFDLITRSFLENHSFRYTAKVSVSIKPQSGWKAWYKQRKRWGIATGVWLRDYYRMIARVLVKTPQIILPSLLLMMPSLLIIFLNCLLPDALYLNIFAIVLSALHGYSGFVPLSILVTTSGILLVKNGIVTAITYTALSFVFYLAARKLGYHFNPIEFLCYYLVYSPLSLLMTIFGIFKVATNSDMTDDWMI